MSSLRVNLRRGELCENAIEQLANFERAVLEQRLKVLKRVDYKKQGKQSWKRLVLSDVEQQVSSSPFVIKLFAPCCLPRRFFYRDYFLDVHESHQRLFEKTLVKTVAPRASGYLGGSSLFPRYLFFVMDYLEGAEQLLSFYHQSTKTKDQIASELAINLALMHEQGIFHYDIKPDHLFIKDDTWYLLDLDEINFRSSLKLHQRLLNLYQLRRFYLDPLGICPNEVFLPAYLAASSDSRPEITSESFERYYQQRYSKALSKHGE